MKRHDKVPEIHFRIGQLVHPIVFRDNVNAYIIGIYIDSHNTLYYDVAMDDTPVRERNINGDPKYRVRIREKDIEAVA